MSDSTAKIVRTIAMFVSALVAQKALGMGWRAVTGKKLPEDDDEDSSLMEIVLAAAAVGALSGLARATAARSTTRIARGRN